MFIVRDSTHRHPAKAVVWRSRRFAHPHERQDRGPSTPESLQEGKLKKRPLSRPLPKKGVKRDPHEKSQEESRNESRLHPWKEPKMHALEVSESRPNQLNKRPAPVMPSHEGQRRSPLTSPTRRSEQGGRRTARRFHTERWPHRLYVKRPRPTPHTDKERTCIAHPVRTPAVILRRATRTAPKSRSEPHTCHKTVTQPHPRGRWMHTLLKHRQSSP